MKITAQKLNKGVTLSKEKLQKAMETQVKMYYKACERLYSLGFISTMYDFDESLFKKALYQEFKEEFHLLKDFSSGAIDFSYERIKYAIHTSSNYKFRVALLYYYDIKFALDSFECFKILWTKAKFKKSSDTIVIKPKLVVISNVKASGIIPFHLEPMKYALAMEDNEELVEVNITDMMYKCLLEKVGVSSREIESAERENDGLLTKSLTFEDECNFIYLILSNAIELDGIYGDKVKSYIENYYIKFYNENNTKTSIESFQERVFIDALNSCVDKVNKFRSEHPDYEEAFISTTSVYFKRKNENKEVSIASNFIGTCVLDAHMREELDKVNNLLGFAGEFISEQAVKNFDWVCEVPPIRLYKNGKLYNYYPSFLVNVDEGINFKPVIGYEIKYNYASSLSLKTVNGGIRFSTDSNVVDDLPILFKKHLDLNDLEVNLLTSMCCIELDKIRKCYTSTNDIEFDSNVADYEEFVSSCQKVVSVYNSIKFK